MREENTQKNLIGNMSNPNPQSEYDEVMEQYEKDIEKLVRKYMGKNIEIKMLDRELEGTIINREVVLEILKELTE